MTATKHREMQKRFDAMEDHVREFKLCNDMTYDEFMQYVRANIKTEGTCKIWQGIKDVNGYAMIYCKGSFVAGYKLMLELKSKRKLKRGEYACHKCGNKLCVNPDHLYIGSQSDNMYDKMVHNNFQGCSLNPTKAQFIRDSTLEDEELAEMFGVNKTLVRSVRSGRSWNLDKINAAIQRFNSTKN